MKPPFLKCLRRSGAPALLLAYAAYATLASGQTPLASATFGQAAFLPIVSESRPATGILAEKAVAEPAASSLQPLPDAPSAVASTPVPEPAGSTPVPEPAGSEPAVVLGFMPPVGNASSAVAPRLTKYIPAGMTAQPITAHDKVLLGLRDLYSPLNFVAMVASAGYEHVVNGAPNYGTDRGAFGQRLGAAAIRESTQGLFTDTVFAPILHEDPRYFVQGSEHNVLYRTIYAGTRPLITRTDHGHSTVNGALLAGYAASTALSYTYYPKINQNFNDMASAFGGSIGGAALGFVVSEFSDDLLRAVHLKKK